jgi:hypothetical protein
MNLIFHKAGFANNPLLFFLTFSSALIVISLLLTKLENKYRHSIKIFLMVILQKLNLSRLLSYTANSNANN